MTTTLANLAEKQVELRNQVKLIAQENVQPALKQAFEELQSVIPNLEAIRWQQYTPHFNDGEACEFGLHGVYYKLQDKTEGGDNGDGYEYISTYGKYNPQTGLNDEGLNKTQVDSLNTFSKNLCDIEEMLQVAFDDHAEVTLLATSIEVEEYSHD